ncbi:gliding motility lipoprotein GldH [Hymenobacter sp. J193]|uniref:gliding motility lipoprotein GldH n=1 Tax=Hymenobacter sp. J193 TaxID=2898429 RepID=UPI00215157C8|nr:gliding motility lipoprotein GldH [Hymenobacter sp. J193]MCR5888737.1 gliding motility lipoprotein GldH [Hymenobacter sp. J193]
MPFRLFPMRGWLAALSLLFLASCDTSELYEQNVDLKDAGGQPYVWAVQEKPSFTFTITDTTQLYDVYFNIRNAADYGYYNLYVKHTLTAPDGRPVSMLLHEMRLLDAKTGEPLGSGSGDIFDHRILALPQQRFRQPGEYRLTLEQYMRQDALPGIMAVGVRVARHTAE